MSTSSALLLFVCGACAFGSGGVFAWRSCFVDEDPQMAGVLLAGAISGLGYVCAVVGAIAWLR